MYHEHGIERGLRAKEMDLLQPRMTMLLGILGYVQNFEVLSQKV